MMDDGCWGFNHIFGPIEWGWEGIIWTLTWPPTGDTNLPFPSAESWRAQPWWSTINFSGQTPFFSDKHRFMLTHSWLQMNSWSAIHQWIYIDLPIFWYFNQFDHHLSPWNSGWPTWKQPILWFMPGTVTYYIPNFPKNHLVVVCWDFEFPKGTPWWISNYQLTQ